MGVTAPLLPPRLCQGPVFLFSLLLTWLIVSFRKREPRGEGEWGFRALVEGEASEPLLHSWVIWPRNVLFQFYRVQIQVRSIPGM